MRSSQVLGNPPQRTMAQYQDFLQDGGGEWRSFRRTGHKSRHAHDYIFHGTFSLRHAAVGLENSDSRIQVLDCRFQDSIAGRADDGYSATFQEWTGVTNCSGGTGGFWLRSIALRRIFENTYRLKKCIPPSTSKTRPTFVLMVSMVPAGSVGRAPYLRASAT